MEGEVALTSVPARINGGVASGRRSLQVRLGATVHSWRRQVRVESASNVDHSLVVDEGHELTDVNVDEG